MLSCPICRAIDVRSSHRRGVLERGPLTWIGILPFRCGQCQTRFYKIALRDPRRRRYDTGATFPTHPARAPRWSTNLPVVVTVDTPGRDSVVLQGVAVNASLEGARLRLPTALPEGSLVSVALEGSPSRLGSVCWSLPQGASEILHGVRFQVPLGRRGIRSRPFRGLRWRQRLRRGLIVLIGFAIMAVAAYGFDWWINQLRTYYPKYYEPKDIERQRYQKQQRLEGPKGPSEP